MTGGTGFGSLGSLIPAQPLVRRTSSDFGGQKLSPIEGEAGQDHVQKPDEEETDLVQDPEVEGAQIANGQGAASRGTAAAKAEGNAAGVPGAGGTGK
eukprot:CAMPEP_0194591634 /NCGR_PEP_ID=MMETSP0292-20121207/22206_1 /TAXON_ID=39354 /ORGANISM="Heterosigma akashiwo, Strain CCMP2393" /LENGTH=96 /DNA_ID=CAMNT_0039449793 /DNA_START=14 /DNA_END=302 /DNA_ORIENTATION=+